jgi:hypothetical protein
MRNDVSAMFSTLLDSPKPRLRLAAKLAIDTLSSDKLTAAIDAIMKSDSVPPTAESLAQELLRQDLSFKRSDEEWPDFLKRIKAILKARGFDNFGGKVEPDGKANDNTDRGKGYVQDFVNPSPQLSLEQIVERHRRYPTDPKQAIALSLEGASQREFNQQVHDECVQALLGRAPKRALDDPRRQQIVAELARGGAKLGLVAQAHPDGLTPPVALDAVDVAKLKKMAKDLIEPCQYLTDHWQLTYDMGRVAGELVAAYTERKQPPESTMVEANQLLARAQALTRGG